ncbi:Acyl-CoA dehydrogenase [Paraburkholderia steynii]|uniref:Acyl-CoA dehydrogenase n=1 Tax=Paraburkholderia steynii TaxID=1245441 RepID=A0A7Z7BB79_9BURK|nr:acyl-CoA dehydrogenase family protein [Paraburkholderia steynii]SDI49890.1 Acyl-CoA dehydrogenase [Paraburkholderia steynii]
MNASGAFPTGRVDEDLVASAAAMVPRLKQRASAVDELARLPQDTIDDLNAAGLFEITTPRRYGGKQASLRTCLEVVAELGRGDASTAWVVALTNVGTWGVASFFDQGVVDEVFGGSKRVRVVGVLSPRKAVVKKLEGGFIIEEGVWGFNSGIYHANWDLLGIPIVDVNGKIIDQGVALVRASDVLTLDDWNVMGLRGTGSTSVSVSNLFIPNAYVASMSQAIEGRYASRHASPDSLYRIACVPMLSIILLFPALGIARNAIDTFMELLPHRGIQYTWHAKQSEAAVTHLQIGEASAKLDAARTIIEKHVDVLDANAASGQYMAYFDRAKVRRDVGLAEKLIWEGIDLLATASGGSLASLGNPFTRIWHDARVASLHGMVTPTTTFETFGRLACGQIADTQLI